MIQQFEFPADDPLDSVVVATPFSPKETRVTLFPVPGCWKKIVKSNYNYTL